MIFKMSKFDYKKYLESRPDLFENWNTPIKAWLHWKIFKKIDIFFIYLNKNRLYKKFKKLFSKKIFSFKFNLSKDFLYYLKPIEKNINKNLQVKIFSFQKDEELVKEWIEHHSEIFGIENLYIIDHDSSSKTVNIYKQFIQKGLNIINYKGDFANKHSVLTEIMLEHKNDTDFLIPIDGDEFIFINKNGTFTDNKFLIKSYLERTGNLIGKFKMTSYENMLEKLDTKNIFIECKYFRKQKMKQKMKKTYFPSKYFVKTDQGNHSGLISKNNNILIDSDLILIHYSRKSYENYVQKIKRGVTAYKENRGPGRIWFLNYNLYKRGKLKDIFIKKFLIKEKDTLNYKSILFENKLNNLNNSILPRKKVSIIFFGITRSLIYTYPYIKKNIFDVLDQHNLLWEIYIHSYDQKYITDYRSGESKILLDHERDIKLFPQDKCKSKITSYEDTLTNIDMTKFISHGDPWENNGQNDPFKNLQNLLLQLNSLKIATNLADIQKNDSSVYLFIRPDLAYLNAIPINIINDCIQNKDKDLIYTPNWAQYGGLNDRFAIATPSAALLYGMRHDKAEEYSQKNKLHSEKFLSSVVSFCHKEGLTMRAVRVRANGGVCNNDTYMLYSRDIKKLLKS
jgi:hypothetical protein